MKLFLALALATVLAPGCGVKGEPVRVDGVEPPPVATSVIRDASTDPVKPRGTLF